VIAALVLTASTAHADPPDRGAALVAGAAVFVAGFAVGGMLIATGNANEAQANAGWLAMESTFAVAPIVAHGAAGDWTRGLVWAAAPAAAAGGTAGLFAYDKGTIFHGSLPEQRWLWGLFGGGLAVGTAGLVDVVLEGKRGSAVALVPSVAPGRFGLAVQGAL
jgi:hypothetical protein